ncbi:hypothetical protein BV902_07885 [Sphingobacterium sp. B29]|nr:hypothetical protein BV902_07885 [Sphingobacterium sp. B29]
MEWIMVDMYCTFFPNKEFEDNNLESKVMLKFEVFTKADLVKHLYIKVMSGDLAFLDHCISIRR